MPAVATADQVLLYVATCKQTQLQALAAAPAGRIPLPFTEMMRQVVSDRLALAAEHLRYGDELLLGGSCRASIGRHYYAMYHAARAIVFGVHQGDDFERHSDLPRNLPSSMPGVASHEAALTQARLLRNQADYDPYPASDEAWEFDARSLASTAASFVNDFEQYALSRSLI